MLSIPKFVSALLLLSTGSSLVTALPVNESEPALIRKRCGGSQFDLTATNYNNAKTDAWLATWWAGATAAQKAEGLTVALTKEFLPLNRDFKCGVNSQCVVGDCDSIDFTKPGATQAYFVLESISSLTQAMTFMWTAYGDAATSANAQSYDVVTEFYTSGVQLASTADKTMSQLIELLVTAISIFVSYYSFGTLSAPLLGIAFNPGKAGQYSSIAIIESLQNWLSKDTSATPADLELQSLATYSNFIAKTVMQGQSSVNTILTGILSGGDDGSGKHLSDYISGGQFMVDLSQTQQGDVEQLHAVMVAGAINVLYTQGYTYIVGVPVLSGQTCQSDTRGPASTKFCRDGDNSVYYAYTLPNHGSPHAQVWTPTSFDKLPSYGITIQQVISSSIKAYYAAGFNYANVQSARWQDAWTWGTGNRPVDQGVAFEGVFTIPVCYDYSGKAVSEVSTNNGRNYPCICGPNGKETGAFRVATGFATYSEYQWCGA